LAVRIGILANGNLVWESEEWLQEHGKKDEGEQGLAVVEEAA
jgi:hypothetical protein